MIGKSLLHYEIKEQIGKGGMGEVFRAQDTKLGRDVALKILPAELMGDPEREARFHREARVLASLQHPNVASVYGFEKVDGAEFLVMELVSGSELTKRMDKGPIPVKDTLAIARQLAAGLEAAHENGIVHRDLKPANIMETPDGEVKILDFGLAQAWFGDDFAQQDSDTSPTLTAAMTQVGVILGTAAYMSPEQARGVNVDRRTDIWAFGVILFEMLTGQKLFGGETVSDTLAAVLRKEPDWSALPVKEAPELCRLVERCLERDSKQRLRDIGEARIFLQDGGMSSSHLTFSQLDINPEMAPPRANFSSWPMMAILALVCLVFGAALGWKVLSQPEPAPLLHTMVPAPGGLDFDLGGGAPGPAVLSPDGSMLIFTASDGLDLPRLFLRRLDQGESTLLPGTEGAAYPFWSPDSRFVAFFVPTDGKLKKVSSAGGLPITLCAAANGKGGSWNEQGEIIFAPDFDGAIYSVSDLGGDPVRLTRLRPQYDSHRHPRFLPGGKRFIFVGRPVSDDINDIFLASLDTTESPRIIGKSQAHAEYADGYLFSVRDGALMGTPFRPDQDEPAVGAIPLVENILHLTGAAVGVFSSCSNGMMVYQTGNSGTVEQVIAWRDIDGGSVEQLGEPGLIFHPTISPDGKKALLEERSTSSEGTDLWLLDLDSGRRSRFTFAEGDEQQPCWSPSGDTVYYKASHRGGYFIMKQSLEGKGGAQAVLRSQRDVSPSSVSPDGKYLLLDQEQENGVFDVCRLTLGDSGGELISLISSGGKDTGGGEYSPDGRWIAYHTESNSTWDVFVVPADGGPRLWQVTNVGAVYPKWNRDGSELWVSEFGGKLRAYSVLDSSNTFSLGDYRQTLQVESPNPEGCNYDLHPDGRRILTCGKDPSFRVEISGLHLVTNWKQALVR